MRGSDFSRRAKRYLLDARGICYDCGTNRDETKGYRKMTLSTDPETLPLVHRRFGKVLERYPLPHVDEPPLNKRWERYFKHHQNT